MSDSRGFTLIEVLLTVALIAVSLLAMATMSVTSYQNVGRGSEQTTGVMLATQRMEWLRNQPYTSTSLNAGTTTTTLMSPYDGYSRTTTIVDNTPIAGMKQVTIQIGAPSGRTVRVVSLIGG
jgi:prepilin-type N-terminal cleavage/methylation domain-containing protein